MALNSKPEPTEITEDILFLVSEELYDRDRSLVSIKKPSKMRKVLNITNRSLSLPEYLRQRDGTTRYNLTFIRLQKETPLLEGDQAVFPILEDILANATPARVNDIEIAIPEGSVMPNGYALRDKSSNPLLLNNTGSQKGEQVRIGGKCIYIQILYTSPGKFQSERH